MRRTCGYLLMMAAATAWSAGPVAAQDTPSSSPTQEEMRGRELAECRQNLETAWSELEALRAKLDETRTALDALHGEKTATREAVQRRDKLLVRLRDALVRQRARADALRKKVEAAEARAKQLEEDLAAERRRTAQLEEESPSRSSERRIAKLERKLAEMGETLVEREARINTLEAAAAAAKKEKAALQRDLKRSKQAAADLENELAKVRRRMEERTAKAEASGSARAAARKAAALEKEVTRLRKTMDEQERLVADLKKEKKAAEEARATLERQARQAGGRTSSLESDLEKARKRSRDLEALLEESRRQVRDLRKAMAMQSNLLKRAGKSAGPVLSPAAEAEEEAAPAPVKKKEPGQAAPGKEAALSPYKLIVEGNKALRENRVDEAEKLFRRALGVDPSLMGARMGLATCAYARSDFDRARELVGELLRENRRNGEALGLAGLIAWQEGDLKLAGRRLAQAVKYEPNDAQLLNYQGIVLHAQKKEVQAIRALRKAVQLDPTHAEAMFNLAVLLATAKVPELDEAKKYYEKAVKLGSDRDEKLEQLLYP